MNHPQAPVPFQSWLLLTTALLLLSLSASAARAEKALLLPAKGDVGLKPEQDQAHEILVEALAAQGVTVMRRTEVVAELTEEQGRDCVSVDCAPNLLSVVGADFAAAIAVWAGEDGTQAASVFVTLVGPRGTRFPGKASIEEGDLPTATRNALVDARGLQLLGPGPWLRVRGTPDGAQLFIDGRMVGTLPYRAVIASGRHTLEVRAQGFKPHIQALDVSPNQARQLDVQVALPASDTKGIVATAISPTDLTASDGPQYERPIWGPLLLGAAGAGVLAAALITAATAGCKVEVESQCVESTSVDSGATVAWSVAGGAAMVGGLLWHLLGRVEVEPTEGLSLDVNPTGVHLKARY